MAAPQPEQHPIAPVPAPAPAPAPAHAPAAGGVISDSDVNDWKNRFNGVLAKPSEAINSKSPADSQSWYSGFFSCLTPVDVCAITCCLPCVTFGKTHHRMRKDGEMKGYEPINTSCLLFFASSCVCLHWLPLSMQRADVRERYHLQGDCITDLVLSCCCGCCSLVQQEKESAHREPLLQQGKHGVQDQYKPAPGMQYTAPQ